MYDAKQLAAWAASQRPPAKPKRRGLMQPKYTVVYDAKVGGGYADTVNNVIHLSPGAGKHALQHELGHLIDAQFLSDGDRAYFAKMLHAPAGSWLDDRTGEGHPEGNPAEWFADYYAAATTGFKPTHRKGGVIVTNDEASYATIGAKRLRRFQAALERLRARHGL